MKIGTAISKVATPIAGIFGMGCYDPLTRNLFPGSPCAKSRDRLDAGEPFWNVMYDRFFNSENKKGGNTMEFIITIAVEAETVEEALEKKNSDGKTMSVNLRPQRPIQTPPQAQPSVK